MPITLLCRDLDQQCRYSFAYNLLESLLQGFTIKIREPSLDDWFEEHYKTSIHRNAFWYACYDGVLTPQTYQNVFLFTPHPATISFNGVQLRPSEELQLSLKECQQLQDDLTLQMGQRWVIPHPSRWYCFPTKHNEPINSAYWRKEHTELELFLYSHPINKIRRNNAQQSIRTILYQCCSSPPPKRESYPSLLWNGVITNNKALQYWAHHHQLIQGTLPSSKKEKWLIDWSFQNNHPLYDKIEDSLVKNFTQLAITEARLSFVSGKTQHLVCYRPFLYLRSKPLGEILWSLADSLF